MTGLVERLVPDDLWELFRQVVPAAEGRRAQGGGRRRAGDREVLAAIVFVATSGCSWREVPPVFGPRWPTVYGRFAQWRSARVWQRLSRAAARGVATGRPLSAWSRTAVEAVAARAAAPARNRTA